MRLERHLLLFFNSDDYFNSIKVRLERSIISHMRCYFPFQFHKGAIRTQFGSESVVNLNLFQFHKGAIRTNIAVGLASGLVLFQFHKGAIRTMHQS